MTSRITFTGWRRSDDPESRELTCDVRVNESVVGWLTRDAERVTFGFVPGSPLARSSNSGFIASDVTKAKEAVVEIIRAFEAKELA